LRRGEFAASLALLGVDGDAVHAFGWHDGAVPASGDAGFAAAVAMLTGRMQAQRYSTLVVPWRRDPHPDHRAAHALALAAMAGLRQPLRMLEYVVWTPERGTAADRPRPNEVTSWRLDISEVVQAKLRAVAAHRSQHGNLIDDDPTGFRLPASMLARCAEPMETYHESVAAIPGTPKEAT
jgi:LmbE family N-acetylglucosaminyl deacetylase